MIKLLICDDNPEITEQVYSLIRIFGKKYKIEFLIEIKYSGEFIIDDNQIYDINIIFLQFR